MGIANQLQTPKPPYRLWLNMLNMSNLAILLALLGERQVFQGLAPPVMATTPTLVSHTDRFDLTQGLSTPKISSVDAEVVDNIEVAIELHQKYSPAVGISCAEDGVFLVDTFGNTTELAFKEKKGARRLDDKLVIVTTFSYGIAFYPAADGE